METNPTDFSLKIKKEGRMFLQPDFDESSINPEIFNAVKSIRNSGIETIASNSGIGQIGNKNSWGSFIQIQLLLKDGLEIAEKINTFAQSLTPELQQELDNPSLSLQLVSAEKWFKNHDTTSMKISNLPIYRLQLVGYSKDEEIRYVWNKVAQKFTPSVIE